MLTFSIQSGSCGNCIYVEAGGVRLLFDAGVSGAAAQKRLACHGRDVRDCDALIISHDHVDHTASAGIFHRKFGLPVYMAPRVHAAVRKQVGPIKDVHWFFPGNTLTFAGVRVHTIPTPHDGIDTVCFVVEHENRRLGIMTDLGHATPAIRDALAQLDAVYLEANYDRHMLETGPYAEPTKQRIRGGAGHLSNDEAAEVARCTIRPQLKWLAVAHLSEINNRPDLALDAQRGRIGRELPLHVAWRDRGGDLLEV